MRSDKHIVLFTPGFPGDESETFCLPPVQNYALCLAASGVAVTVVSLHYPFHSNSYKWNGIQVMALGGANVGYPKRLGLWKRAASALKQIHQKDPITTLHSFWFSECALIGNYFSRKSGVDHVITLMGQDVLSSNKFNHMIGKSRAKIVAVSEYQINMGLTRFKDPDAIISWEVSPEDAKLVKAVDKDIDVIGIGSLIDLKNYPLFLQVLRRLLDQIPGLKAVIVGDGIARGSIKKLISELGLRDCVKLLREQPREVVFEYLSRSKVLLHTSLYESQGYIFNEARLAGLPIVSTPVGIAREDEAWKVGREEKELADAIHYFLSNPVTPQSRMQKTMEDVVEAYLEVYFGDRR